MATVFELPMPALDDAQTNQITHQRRRRDSVEVIDVDELDDDVYQTHRPPESDPSRPTQRRRLTTPSEIISLVDSDDDDIVVSESNTRPASRTRLQSPPPRNPQWGLVPPVPPVPPRYAGQTSFPMRRQGPAYSSPPVIRPNDQPFPFEVNMHQQQQPHRHLAPIHGPGPSNRPPQLHIPRLHNPEPLPPRPLESIQPAPPSHHIPAMGLGGALIAQNRPRHQNQHRPHPYEAGQSLFGRVGSGVRRIFSGPALGPGGPPRNGINFLAIGNNFDFLEDSFEDDHPDRILALQLLAEDEGEGLRDVDPAFNPARAFIRSEMFRRRNNARDEPPYKKEYTHPHPPENGFTFDFAPNSPVEVIDFTSPPLKKKRISSPGPIVIVDDDDESVSDVGPSATQGSPPSSSSQTQSQTLASQKSANTNVLACARCLDPLVLGSNLTSEEQKDRRVWGLRCGHLIDGKCLKEIGQPYFTDQLTTLRVIDRKGKGKAKAMAEDEDEYQHTPGAYGDESEPNSIRSRLRPRNTATPSTLASTSSSTAHTSTRRNGRAKAIPLTIPEYLWHCPVTGCGRVHVSVKVNGEWIPERDDSIYADSTHAAGNGGGRGRRGARGRPRATNYYGIVTGTDHLPTNEGPRGAIPLFL